MNRHCMILLACAGFWVLGNGQNAAAQGLIVSLPKDGTWVRFEGTVKQIEYRPDAPEGNISMEWIQHLTIKSVGTETAEFRGKQVPCRWIEIKVTTGKSSESGVDAGPVGDRLYKVLVPEVRVVGQTVDRERIPFSFLDVVKGFRKIGGEMKPVPPGALQVFPLIAPVMHYDAIAASGSATEEIQTPNGAVKTKKFKAKRQIESPTLRTTNEADLWRCETDSVPFGLARWTVKTTLEKKASTQPRSDYKPATQMTIEMTAHEWGTGAKSELAKAPADYWDPSIRVAWSILN